MKNKIINNHLGRSLVTGLFLCLTLQGCASTVLRPVSVNNKDVTNKYDGSWKSMAISTAAKQHAAGGWQLTCNDMAGRDLGTFTVNNGIATLGDKNDISTAFVSESGKFRFEIPTVEVAAARGTSDATLNNGSMTVILYGSLEKQTGTLTFGVADFGNNGCSTKVNYSKV